jgi:predicted ribosome quality control (RQC) complex YloA/Tae2 family protein
MQAEKLAKYLSELKTKTGLSYEAISEMSDRPESTVKNLCMGKTDNPGIDTVVPIIYALGGSLDEMFNPNKSKDEVKETAVISLKDSYEYQMTLLKEAYDEQINNIRSHYDQHHNDLKENYEKRLSDKRELIESYKEHNNTLAKESRQSKIALWICIGVFVAVLIAELMNPNLGWFRY